MSAVYSKLLASGLALPAGSNYLGEPPPGYAWIVRDIVAFWPDWRGYGLGGFLVEDTNGLPIFGRQAPYVSGGIIYHWSGAQVLETPTGLSMVTSENTWGVRISGFALTLP